MAYRASPGRALIAARLASTVALGFALAALFRLSLSGPSATPVLGIADLGISFLIDPLSAAICSLIAFIGFLVLEYSRNYLAGDERQNVFTGHLLLTVATAILMVSSGNLLQLTFAWMGMSLSLHQLLIFYRERPKARLAARKKFLVARVGDTCLAAAAILLVASFGTGSIAGILEGAQNAVGSAAYASHAAAVLIAIAAILKSAQFPTHGWITEVMETPTPVSALLHAGIVNAGGFLVLRFADLMLGTPAALQTLLIVGGFTALFGSLVMTTQTAIKTSLAYSTVAQMGFMLLQCGFGAFSSAGLHLVAHSLYKAHSFLASGTAIDQVRLDRSVAADQRPSALLLVLGLAFALSIYVGIGALFEHRIAGSLAVQTLGAIFIMGLFVLIARGASSKDLLIRVVPVAALSATLYFTLQIGAAVYFDLPPVPYLSPASQNGFLAGLVLVTFALVTLHQVLPAHSTSRWYRTAFVHLRNGLYTNSAMTRLTGANSRDFAK